jgi:type IV pilus biogenesis protein CpaD/CtpE
MGPNTVVVVRSEYLLGFNNCPNYSPATTANPNEAAMPGFGCSDSYNMGQMLARPRDAAVGRPAGPADATINALAIARYREGKVAALNTSGLIGGAAAGGGGGGGAGGGGAGGGSSGSSN